MGRMIRHKGGSEFERQTGREQKKQTVHPNSTNSINTVSTGPGVRSWLDHLLLMVRKENKLQSYQNSLIAIFSLKKKPKKVIQDSVRGIRQLDKAGECREMCGAEREGGGRRLVVGSGRGWGGGCGGRGGGTVGGGGEKVIYGEKEAQRIWSSRGRRLGCSHGDVVLGKRFRGRSRILLGFHCVLDSDEKDCLIDGTIDEEDYKYKHKRMESSLEPRPICGDKLKKFNFATMKTASTPMEPNKALIKDEEANSVDVNLYRSLIESLMYLTTSRPDIMFDVVAYETVYKEWEDRMERAGHTSSLARWQSRPVESNITLGDKGTHLINSAGALERMLVESTTRTPISVSSSSIKDKGKAKMDEPEVPLKKKDQIALDEKG
ncbi:hypothetical protein Tco_0228404 [Tanacetum coccineum]